MATKKTAPSADPKTTPVKYDFFIVHPVKMVLLTFTTILLYLVYWEYKNWSVIKAADKSDSKPFWRAFFSPVFTYSLLQKMGVDGKRAKLTIAAVLIPVLASIWPRMWWVWITSVLPLALVQADYNKRNRVMPKFLFTPKAAAVAILGLIHLAVLLNTGIMTRPYSMQPASTKTTQAQKETEDHPEESATTKVEEQKPADDAQEKPTEAPATDEPVVHSTPTTPTAPAAPKVAAKAPATPQPPKKTPYQIQNGGRLNISVSSIHIQRFSGNPYQTFTISSPDGKNISQPQTVGSSMWLASYSSQPDRATSYTLFLQPGSATNGTYTVNFEALHSTDESTWRYTGSVLVYITD